MSRLYQDMTRDELIVELRRLLEQVRQLRSDLALFYALQAAGVDNWEGYEEARDSLSENNEESDDE